MSDRIVDPEFRCEPVPIPGGKHQADTSKVTSSSTGVPSGRLATPYTKRQGLLLSEDVLQQLRSGVSDFRLIADISRSDHRHAEPDDPRHFVERSQMLPRGSEDVKRREVSRLAPRVHIELRADAPNEFRPVAFRGKHPAQKKQIARLHRFHIGAERLRRRRELDAKFFQPLLGTGRPRAFAGYHLPTCAPPSTCSTSPVT